MRPYGLRIQQILSAIAATLAIASIPAQAGAAFPGRDGKIAFINSYRDANGVTYTAKRRYLETARPDGTHRRVILKGSFSDPSFSGTGHRILFEDSKRSHTLYFVRASGKGKTRIPHTEHTTPGVAISLNGKTVAYIKDDKLRTIRVDGSGRRTLAAHVDTAVTGVAHDGVAFAPGGEQIVYSDGCALFKVSVRGGVRRQLTGPYASPRACDHSPDFSPDGRTIVFRHDAEHHRAGIRTIERSGSHLKRLIESPVHGKGPPSNPAYSPNGRHILFQRFFSGFKLSTVRADGTHLRTSDPVLTGVEPSWGAAR